MEDALNAAKAIVRRAASKPASQAAAVRSAIDDHEWFATHRWLAVEMQGGKEIVTSHPWDWEAPYWNRGICPDFPAPAERAQQERQDKAA